MKMNQKERLKILLPTLREKERYIKFKLISEEPVEYADLEAAIWSTFLEFYGEEGVSRFSLWLIKNLWNPKEQTAVLKCNNKSVQQVLAGLGLISRLGDTRVIFKILGISGTLKKLKD
jgi:ribonuclease P/MRP protein subunit POP5